MKTIKRIIAVLLLTLIVAVVGYLAYTGSRQTALSGDGETAYTETNLQAEAVYEQAESL